MPVLVAGDFDTTRSASAYLTLAHADGTRCISPNIPTTANRSGTIAESEPLDHALINARFLDLDIRADVRYDVVMSDHFLIVGSWNMAGCSELPIQKRLAKMDLSGPPVETLPWRFGGATYTEWAHAATKWLSDTYMVPQISKTTVTATQKRDVHIEGDLRFRCFHRLLGRLSRDARNPGEDHVQNIRHCARQLSLEIGLRLGVDCVVASVNRHASEAFRFDNGERK